MSEDPLGLGISESEEIPAEVPQEDAPENNIFSGVAPDDMKYTRGFDPNGEKTLEQYISDGKFMEDDKKLRKQMQTMQKDFEQRTQSLVKLHEMQQDILRKELEEKLEDAVNMSDIGKVKEISKQMDDMDRASESVQPPSPSGDIPEVVMEWNKENPWIEELTPKAAYARDVYYSSINNGDSPEDAIDKVESEIAKHFPANTSAPPRIPKTTTSHRIPGQKSNEGQMTWNELTADEVNFWNKFGKNAFKSKEEYLQAVKDSRGGKDA